VVLWIATGGYSGYIRIVPATFGSFVGLLLFVPLTMSSVSLQLTLTGLLFFLGVWTSGQAEKLMKKKDARPIVIDEIVGMWISLLFIPQQITYFLGAFILFSLLDILKPFPANQAQCLTGGLGIMIDDVVAGLYTNAILHIIYYFL